jgi:aconitate hydratase 2/2-methylisocitrate dehydratase
MQCIPSIGPGDGIIHSWLNRMLLPDTVGTGGDSHTRFPIGISFPAGSGLVAFGAATGVMVIPHIFVSNYCKSVVNL